MSDAPDPGPTPQRDKDNDDSEAGQPAGPHLPGGIEVTNGDYVAGDKTVNQTIGGDFIGRDKVNNVVQYIQAIIPLPAWALLTVAIILGVAIISAAVIVIIPYLYPIASPTPTNLPARASIPALVNSSDHKTLACLGDGTTNKAVLAIQYDTAHKNLWAGTNTGLVHLNETTNEWSCAALPANTMVRALAVDRDGDVWVVDSMGISKLDVTGTTRIDYPLAAGLSADDVRALAVGNAGQIWVGYFDVSASATIRVFNASSQAWGEETDSIDVPLFESANSLAVRPTDNTLWIATDQGLRRLDNNDHWMAYRSDNGIGQMPDNTVKSLVSSANGRLWIGTGAGVVSLDDNGTADASDDQWPAVQPPSPDAGWDAIVAICLSPDGRVWVGSANGVWRITPDTQPALSAVMLKLGANADLPAGHIYALGAAESGGQGMLWIGTDKGLFSWSRPS